MILDADNQAVALRMGGSPDLHYTYLDFADEVDFHCAPVLFIEANRSPRAKVAIGRFTTVLPMDWSILVGDRETGFADLVTVRDAIARRFDVLVMNPWSDRLPTYLPITNLGSARRFVSPKLGKRQLMASPLIEGAKPPCVFVARDVAHFSAAIDVAELVS